MNEERSDLGLNNSKDTNYNERTPVLKCYKALKYNDPRDTLIVMNK